MGAGTRISGGWQLAGVSAQPADYIRALGFSVGGFASGSGWPVEAVVGPPYIATDAGLGFISNRFTFTIVGKTGQAVVTEASTNLVHWLPLQTNFLTSGSCEFSDPASPAHPRRFYRLRLLP